MKNFLRSRGKQTVNVWKVVSVIFIFLFILVLVSGLFRVQDFKGSFKTPTQDQIEYAKAIVARELQNQSDDINNYQFIISEDIRRFDRITPSKNIIQVSLQKNSTMQMFLIDIDSGEVLMHSKTEFYGGPGPMPGNMIGGFIR